MSNAHGEGTDGFDVTGLAGLYALDALEGVELEQFESYLESHPEARDEVDEFRQTAARLAVTAAEPAPSSMRDQVLGSISSVRQEPPRLDVERARRRQRASRRIASIAAAVVLVVAAGTGGYLLGQDTTPSGTETADGLTSILANDDATFVDLQGDSGLSARLVWSESAQGAVVVADDLPGPPDGQTYELWKVRDGQPVSAGLFVPRDGSVHVPVDAQLAAGDTVAVTIEPDGGSESPTMPIVMSATV